MVCNQISRFSLVFHFLWRKWIFLFNKTVSKKLTSVSCQKIRIPPDDTRRRAEKEVKDMRLSHRDGEFMR